MGTAPISPKDESSPSAKSSEIPRSELTHQKQENQTKDVENLDLTKSSFDPKIILGIVFFFIAIFVSVWLYRKQIKNFFKSLPTRFNGKKKIDENKKLEKIEDIEKPELEDK